MDELVRWATLAFLMMSSLMQAAYFFGGKGKRDVSESVLTELKDVRKLVRDLVDFWETRFVTKEVADARYQDIQGQLNRLREDVTQITKRSIH